MPRELLVLYTSRYKTSYLISDVDMINVRGSCRKAITAFAQKPNTTAGQGGLQLAPPCCILVTSAVLSASSEGRAGPIPGAGALRHGVRLPRAGADRAGRGTRPTTCAGACSTCCKPEKYNKIKSVFSAGRAPIDCPRTHGCRSQRTLSSRAPRASPPAPSSSARR